MAKIEESDESIQEFLRGHPLVKFDADIRRNRVEWRLGKLLPAHLSPDWIALLSWFTCETPLSYWDIETVVFSLGLLENDIDRSIEAVRTRIDRIDLAFRNLSPLLSATYDDASVASMKTSTIVRLAEIFHPDYLRCAEHIFGHLISMYCGVTVRRPGTNKFDLGGSVKQLAEGGYHCLIDGFDDRIRNAIAHGQILFTANGVVYGQYVGAPERSPREVAEKFDKLWRTCTSLCVGLLLFFLRHQGQANMMIPIYLNYLLATKSLEHEGMTLQGFSESTIAGVGDQLHVSLKISAKTRFDALHEVSLLAYKLVTADLKQYSRYIFDVDSGVEPSGLVIVNAHILSQLVAGNAKWTRLREAFEDPIMLWHDQGPVKSRVRAYREIFTAVARHATHNFVQEVRTRKPISNWVDFSIRGIENRSVSGVVRIQVTAIVADYIEHVDQEKIKAICKSIIRLQRAKFFDGVTSDLERQRQRFNLPGRPTYVWVTLYRRNGTLRWLRGGKTGNLIARAEWHKSTVPPISIRKPDAEDGSYRFSFAKPEETDLDTNEPEIE